MMAVPRRTIRLVLFAASVLLLSPGPIARGDVLHLKNGQKLEGKIVSDTPEAVEIQTKFGSVRIAREKIERIELLRLPQEEVEFRLEQAGGEVAKLYEVALFAKEHHFDERCREILERVVELDPRHAKANQALGRVEFEGDWYTPEQLEQRKAAIAEDMKQQGRVLYKGNWVKEETAKRLSGLEMYEGQWLRWSEIYRLQAEKLMPSLLGEMLEIRESEHFTLRSKLPEEQQTEILELAEKGFTHFEDVFRPDETEENMMRFYPIPIYVLPRPEMVARFVEPGGYMNQLYNPPKGINERYLDVTSFPIFFPRPLIVTSFGGHLVGGEDQMTSLRGFIAHYEGNLLVRRFKRGGEVAGWVEAGLSHYYEGLLNDYSTLSFTQYADFEHVEVVENGLENFPEWYEAMTKPEFRAQLPAIGDFKGKQVEELAARELVKSYFLVTWLMETRPTEFVDYVRLAYSQQLEPRVKIGEAEAFRSVFPEGAAAFEDAFEAWAAQLAPRPPV